MNTKRHRNPLIHFQRARQQLKSAQSSLTIRRKFITIVSGGSLLRNQKYRRARASSPEPTSPSFRSYGIFFTTLDGVKLNSSPTLDRSPSVSRRRPGIHKIVAAFSPMGPGNLEGW